MAQIAIDDALYAQVAELAQASDRPVEQVAEAMLRDGVRQRLSSADWQAVFDEIAALTPKDIAQTDSVIMLREDRDR